MEMDEWRMEKVKMVGAGVSGSASQKDDLRSTGRSVNLPRAWQNVPS